MRGREHQPRSEECKTKEVSQSWSAFHIRIKVLFTDLIKVLFTDFKYFFLRVGLPDVTPMRSLLLCPLTLVFSLHPTTFQLRIETQHSENTSYTAFLSITRSFGLDRCCLSAKQRRERQGQREGGRERGTDGRQKEWDERERHRSLALVGAGFRRDMSSMIVTKMNIFL